LIIPEASSSAFSGATRIPVSPSLIISGIPPTFEATTGVSLYKASVTVKPKPSFNEKVFQRKDHEG